ncbi:MAG: hypothetical protein QE269_08620 [Fimbriimonas sp.]|jgi:hypothetical protein|nr:hypothetical protein [Fimbriimonas sp.]
MKSVSVSPEDFDFLTLRATEQNCSVEELLEQMILRERILAKAPQVSFEPAKPNLEPPHRKWGM